MLAGAMRQINIAMHNTHYCYAAFALQKEAGPDYLRGNKIDDRFSKRASTTMNLIQNFRNWRRYRETMNELSRLSNRELADLGISRSEIPYVARKSSF
ncbi:hypothetical protein GCM10023174_30410 [Chelativorans composti]